MQPVLPLDFMHERTRLSIGRNTYTTTQTRVTDPLRPPYQTCDMNLSRMTVEELQALWRLLCEWELEDVALLMREWMEKLDDSYVSRMVNLTTLAPDLVAAILDETLPAEVTLFDLAAGTPVLWEEQRGRLEENDDRS
jgi:hypothetical protein